MLWLAFLCYFFCAFRCQHRSESPSSYHRSTHTRSSQTLNLCTFQGAETNKNLALFLLTFSFKNLPSMAKTRPGVDSYTIKGTNKVVRAGEYCVLMRPSDAGKPPYVARVEKIEADARNNVKVHCRWYYRPEEPLGGRRQFHGAKELFLSDHLTFKAHTPLWENALFTPSKATRGLKTLGQRIIIVDSSTRLLLVHLLLTELLLKVLQM